MDAVEEKVAEARVLAQRGDKAGALAKYRQVLEVHAKPGLLAEANAFIGGWHEAEGRLDDAIQHYAEGVRLASDHHAFRFNLGHALELARETKAALEQYLEAIRFHAQNARYYLHAGCVLNDLGESARALSVWSIGAQIDPMLLHAQHHPKAGADLRKRSALADNLLRAHFTDLHAQSIVEFVDVPRVSRAFWPQTHTEEVSFQHEMQRPGFFYMPDLPAIPVFENLDWAADLEAASDDIRKEYLSAQGQVTGKPYVHDGVARGEKWNALKDSNNWRSIHLFENAVCPEGMAELFPKTIAALAAVPTVQVNDVPLEVFFSVLEPGAHIPPHFGLANSRMTVHLPLVIPENCGIRVGETAHNWTQGKVFAFDDSFEHEAWNRSDQTRVVLIFEAWVPDLSDTERAAITASFKARTAWLAARRIPDFAELA